MIQIGAVYSSYAASLLHDAFHPLQVEAVFQTGYNIRAGANLLYIGTTKNGYAPFGIHMKTVDQLKWRVGDCLLVGTGATIHHISTGVTVYPNQVMRMKVERIKPDPVQFERNIEEMNRFLKKLGHDWSRAYREKEQPLYDYLSNIGQEKGKQLIGYGEGLTPSGDDVIVGYMAVCEVLGRPMGWQVDYVSSAKYRTTRSSVAYYEAALRGEYTNELNRLITALLTRSPSDWQSDWERLIEFGSSSGQDTALGIYLALKYEMEDMVR
ncbi:MAG: DUF2877 domain-containing protein [Exiguobacterium marinum]|uniref:DUF2877 domain-containing protein n=1 Tax=Exiguobacterium marinum TaxID=273528 RepID=UPI003C3C8F70